MDSQFFKTSFGVCYITTSINIADSWKDVVVISTTITRFSEIIAIYQSSPFKCRPCAVIGKMMSERCSYHLGERKDTE